MWKLADKYPQARVVTGGWSVVHTVARAAALRRGLGVATLTPEKRPSAVYALRLSEVWPDRDVVESGDEPFVVQKQNYLLPAPWSEFKDAKRVASTILVEKAVQVVVFHYAESEGTWHERREAERLGRTLHVIEEAGPSRL